MSSDDQTKHTIRLYHGDYARLQELYPKIGANAVIRKLVHDYLDKVDPRPAVPSNLDIRYD